MNDLNISEFEFDRNVIIIQKLIDLQGEKALHQLKDVSYNDKILILSIFDRALHLGGLSNDQDTIMTYNEILKQADLFQISRTTVKTSTSVNIHLDSSVKSITRTAAYHLSSAIQNGMLISNNNDITIYKNRIDFGKCTNPNFQGKTGMVAPNFYIEYGNVMYYFGNNLKCGWLHKHLIIAESFHRQALTTKVSSILFILVLHENRKDTRSNNLQS